MFEFWGEQIRGQLADLTWISRLAGLAETAVRLDEDIEKRFPRAKGWPGTPCPPGEDFLNMSPDGTESAIAFIVADKEIKKGRAKSQHFDFTTTLGVVVWYDTAKVEITAPNPNIGLEWYLAMQVVDKVKLSNLLAPGVAVFRKTFSGIVADPTVIWSKLGYSEDAKMLFSLPYRTFQVNFTIIGRLIPQCFEGTVNLIDCTCC